jgi:hypothetical protein
MPGLDDLAPLFHAIQGGPPNVSAPMPAAMPLPAAQIAQMPPGLPMAPSPVRETGPSGPTRGKMPWGELMRTLAPVVGGLAAGGRGPGATGFMQGFQNGAAMAAQEQDKRKKESDDKQAQAAKFRMEIFDAARQITDPSEWAKFVEMATDSALQMGLIAEPGEFKRFLEYPAHLEQTRKQKELLDRLHALTSDGYDLAELMEQPTPPVLTLKDGSRIGLREAITISGAYPEGQSGAILPPKPVKTTPPSDYEQSFARYLKGIGKTPETATSTDEFEFKKLFNQADDKPVDPELADMNRTLKLLQIDAARQRGQQPSGLPPNVQRQVDALAKGFDAQPAVKRAQMAAEAVSFANSLDTNSKNPADDQALIYAFAKAMDPDSVVREGEYATVQKYAQSWAQSFGFNAARVFSNTAFLTPQARANMKRTIQQKFTASRGQYTNLRKSYADRINKKTGQGDGESYLTDYGGAFPDTAAPTQDGGANRIYYDANGDPVKK